MRDRASTSQPQGRATNPTRDDKTQGVSNSQASRSSIARTGTMGYEDVLDQYAAGDSRGATKPASVAQTQRSSMIANDSVFTISNPVEMPPLPIFNSASVAVNPIVASIAADSVSYDPNPPHAVAQHDNRYRWSALRWDNGSDFSLVLPPPPLSASRTSIPDDSDDDASSRPKETLSAIQATYISTSATSIIADGMQLLFASYETINGDSSKASSIISVDAAELTRSQNEIQIASDISDRELQIQTGILSDGTMDDDDAATEIYSTQHKTKSEIARSNTPSATAQVLSQEEFRESGVNTESISKINSDFTTQSHPVNDAHESQRETRLNSLTLSDGDGSNAEIVGSKTTRSQSSTNDSERSSSTWCITESGLRRLPNQSKRVFFCNEIHNRNRKLL
jgi:hypothetical protein